jgi:hypothetical protein
LRAVLQLPVLLHGRLVVAAVSCTYPWLARNGADAAFTFGGDYPGTTQNFGRVLQYDQDLDCVSPAGPLPQYCSTVLH